MKIDLVYEPSTSLAPAGFFTAMSFAAAQLDNLLTDNITVSIDISWNNAVLGEAGPTMMSNYDYSTVVDALKAHAGSPAAVEAADDLPSTDPTGGAGVYLSIAQEEALGLSGTSSLADGTATFGTDGTILDFSTTDFAISGEIDFVGVAEHELTHALGRSGWGDGSAHLAAQVIQAFVDKQRRLNHNLMAQQQQPVDVGAVWSDPQDPDALGGKPLVTKQGKRKESALASARAGHFYLNIPPAEASAGLHSKP